jgi:hypothetical protein
MRSAAPPEEGVNASCRVSGSGDSSRRPLVQDYWRLRGLEQVPLVELDRMRSKQLTNFIGERRSYVMHRLPVDLSAHSLDL